VRIHKSGHEAYSFSRNLALIQPSGMLLMASIVLGWYLLTSTTTKLEAITMAATYSFIEFSWYTFTIMNEHHVVLIAPLSVRGRNGFTSVEQFILNVLYIPIALHCYCALFEYPNLPWILQNISALVRTMCFPFNIWLLEIVQNWILRFLYGFNPAWDYTGAPGSRFGGAINVAHWKLWVALGTVLCICRNAWTGCLFIITLLSSIHILKAATRWHYQTF